MGNFAENLNLGNRFWPPCKLWKFWERPLFDIREYAFNEKWKKWFYVEHRCLSENSFIAIDDDYL